ncbi:MAG TPA: 50S ribosomal protein L25 [Acidimicrobiales bacterium]|nr:50S ribosomal protein L25 [Acidimicrobiales bacterium]
MADVTLVAEIGRKTGSGESRRLRHAGRIPAVVYGHGMEPLVVSIEAREFRHAMSGHGLNQVLSLEVEGTKHIVLARQLQRHPVRRTVSHVDFQVVRRDEVVQVNVPLVLDGDASKVTRAGGVIEHVLTSLSVHTQLGSIPEEIAVDVSGLSIGDVVRVRDLKLPAGVSADVDADEAVVIAAGSTVAADVAEDEAAAEGAGTEVEATTEGASGEAE